MPKVTKQIIYGFFYLTVLLTVGWGIYASGFFSASTCFDGRLNQGEEEIDCGGPCIACAIKRLQLIRAETQIFNIDGNTNAVVIFSNPNIGYGARSFSYILNFYNLSQEKIFSLTKETFIYPAEAQKIVIEPNLKVNFSVIAGRPEVLIENLQWAPVKEFNQPRTQLRQVKTELIGNQANISGLLANREPFALSRAVVNAIVVYKTSRMPIGASKTILQNLQPFEERAFKIIAPLNAAPKIIEFDVVLAAEVLR